MPHSLSNIWIHSIWSTKNRVSLLDFDIESQVYSFMYEEFKTMNCPAKIINGMPDHVHVLFLLNSQKAPAEVIKQVKGSTSQFINYNNLTQAKFSWQTGYSSFSVSQSILNKVYGYIHNQKAHHNTKDFMQEMNEFFSLHGITPNE